MAATLTPHIVKGGGHGRVRISCCSVNTVLNVHRNHKAYWGRGEGYEDGGKREIMAIYLSSHCHHQNDSFMKMDGDESLFNVSLVVRDKVTRQCPQTTTFEEEGEPKRIRTEVPLLTGLTPYG